MSPSLSRRRDLSPPPRKPANPEETAYLRAIEKQKQERETVLKMKAIKRKLEVEKKKREGDKQDSPEKKEPTSPGTSLETHSSPKKSLMSAVILKPKIKGK
jgi:hypothetical protein